MWQFWLYDPIFQHRDFPDHPAQREGGNDQYDTDHGNVQEGRIEQCTELELEQQEVHEENMIHIDSEAAICKGTDHPIDLFVVVSPVSEPSMGGNGHHKNVDTEMIIIIRTLFSALYGSGGSERNSCNEA